MILLRLSILTPEMLRAMITLVSRGATNPANWLKRLTNGHSVDARITQIVSPFVGRCMTKFGCGDLDSASAQRPTKGLIFCHEAGLANVASICQTLSTFDGKVPMDKNNRVDPACQYYCPVCGGAMRMECQHTELRGRVWDYTIATCETPDCAAYRWTSTTLSLDDGSFAARSNFEQRYDVRTGESLLIAEIEGLYTTCNLLLTPDQRSAFYADTATPDAHLKRDALRAWASYLGGAE